MPLDFPSPPQESLVSLQEGLQRLPARNKYAFATEAAGGQPPSISLAHEVFVLNPQDVVAGKGLDSATATSWRYILNQQAAGAFGNSSTATAEVVYDGGAHVFSNLQHGSVGNATRQAIEVASKLPAVQNGAFDLRVLRMPATRVDSVWLKSKSGSGDIVVPIRSAIETLSAFRAYDSEEFLSKVKEFLEKQEPFDNSPRVLQR
jgi:hypothetical protein